MRKALALSLLALFLGGCASDPADRDISGTWINQVAIDAAAQERGHVRLDWVALEWNEPALNFYEKLGARRLDDWKMLRLERDGIARLAGGGEGDG